jgi:hypothetical protein
MEENKTTINYQLYEIDKIFKNDFNLVNYVNSCQEFFNGKQYPNENFKNMIRVTMNICRLDVETKASRICGTPIYLTFTADDNETDCTALRQFDEYNCNKLRLKEENGLAVKNALTNGTEVTYIRWDDEDTSYKGIYKGGLVEEHIDLRQFAVANPYIKNIQKQQWVMFWEDYSVGALKEMVEGKNEEEKRRKRELIERSISEENEYKNKSAINHALCRMWTRFFRINGEVYFTCETKNVSLFTHPHPLSTLVSEKIIKKVVEQYERDSKEGTPENGDQVFDYKIDYEDIPMNITERDIFTDKEYEEVKEKFSLYPFAVYVPYRQNRSFYGKSDIEDLISTQKGINFAISMALKCMENGAYNKILAKEDALGDQIITNSPGQVIFDKSRNTNGWGIKYMENQPMPNGLIEFASNLIAMTRNIYGFSEVMDGTITNQDMSGYMLSQMIKAANTNIEQQQLLFWLYNEDKAAIRLMYYKHYVDKAKYVIEMDDATYEAEEQARQILRNRLAKVGQLSEFPEAKIEDFEKPTHKRKVLEMRKEDLFGKNFDISIEAMQGINDSQLVENQMWDNLLLNGGINNISPEILNLYLQASPNVSARTKTALKRVVENLERSKIKMLENQLQELMGKTQQIMAYAKQLEAANGYQGKYLDNLQSEFSSKITSQNKIINGLSKDLESYLASNPTTEGEVKSNNARGIEGTSSQ